MRLKEACAVFADLIEADPKLWTHGALARNATGKMVNTYSPEACCWCLVGGVEAASGKELEDVIYWLMPTSMKLFNRHPAQVNDKLGRKAAIKLLREASK